MSFDKPRTNDAVLNPLVVNPSTLLRRARSKHEGIQLIRCILKRFVGAEITPLLRRRAAARRESDLARRRGEQQRQQRHVTHFVTLPRQAFHGHLTVQ